MAARRGQKLGYPWRLGLSRDRRLRPPRQAARRALLRAGWGCLGGGWIRAERAGGRELPRAPVWREAQVVLHQGAAGDGGHRRRAVTSTRAAASLGNPTWRAPCSAAFFLRTTGPRPRIWR